LREGARELGLGLTEEVFYASCDYLQRILEANTQQNLTRIHESESAVRLHLLDSLSAVPEVAAAPQGELLDIGTGGGFPGVPLALATKRKTVLLDSSQKKIRAVAAALADARIGNVDSVSARAEEFAVAHAGTFAVVVARAVAPLAALVELAAPLLIAGGHAVFLKGTPDAAERGAGAVAASTLGLRELRVRELKLPGGGERRSIVTYERIGASSIALPRRTGLAQKRPLA
jgi:16S rRNA (guanine527-N7)-methyltransferase